VDEGASCYDSGFIQPVDSSARVTAFQMIAVSPFSPGGHVRHIYGEHSSFVKFVERNWYLSKLTAHSRHDLPNPREGPPYLNVSGWWKLCAAGVARHAMT
jgi:phospholipase C